MFQSDFLKELRTGTPDIEKARKAMRNLGWICIFAAIWNFGGYFTGPFDEAPFNLPPSFPYLVLVSFLFIGGLFLHSSRALKNMDPFGKTTGRLAVVVFFAQFVVPAYYGVRYLGRLPLQDGNLKQRSDKYRSKR